MKKIIGAVLALALTLSLSACGGGNEGGYPTRNIQGTVMWSAGGVCDVVSRAAGAAAQQELGKTIVFTNRPGSAGGVSTAYVNSRPADGYELLFGAENPQIAKVMGTGTLDYSDFIPVCLLCSSYGGIFVAKDSPYQTLNDLVEDMKANPGKVVMATTGAGGLPQTVATIMGSVTGVEATMAPFDGENECAISVMGGNARFGISTLGSIAQFYRSGDIRILAMFHNERLEGFEDVPAITEILPGYEDILPWGPFYGVFVKAGTDPAVVETLTAAFEKACGTEDFRSLVAARGCFVMGTTGQEAVDYLERYRSVTSYMLYDSGVAGVDPATVGIER